MSRFYIRYRTNSKYGAKKREVDGIKFDSIKESRRYEELKLLEQTGEISDLQLQVRFELQPSFKIGKKTYRSIDYIADFVYVDDTGKTIVEDVKGFETPEFKLKKKLLLYKYPNINFYVNKEE